VSEYEAGGGFTQAADAGQDLYAVLIKVLQDKILLISGAEGTRVHDVHNEHYLESHQESEEKGLFGSEKQLSHSASHSVQSVQAQFTSPKGAEIIAFGDIDLTNINLQVPHTVLRSMGGVVRILLGTNQFMSQSMSYESDMLSQHQESHKEYHQTYTASQIPGTVEVDARNLIIEQVRGQALDWLQRVQTKGAGSSIQTKWLAEVHQVEHHESSSISPALVMVVGLAVSIALAGSDMGMGSTLISGLGITNATAASFITGATTAAFASVCSQAALSMLNHQGNIGKTLKDLTSKAGFKAVVMAAMSGGLTKGIGAQFNTTVVDC
jgi:hypothetical protein